MPGPSLGSPGLQVGHWEEKAKEAEGMGSQGEDQDRKCHSHQGRPCFWGVSQVGGSQGWGLAAELGGQC